MAPCACASWAESVYFLFPPLKSAHGDQREWMKKLDYVMLTKEMNFATCECPEAHQRPRWGRLVQITE